MKRGTSTSIRHILIAMGCLCLASSLAEEAKKIERWPLSKILKRALEASPLISASSRDVAAAEYRARQDGKWDNPEISATLGRKSVNAVKGKALQISILQSIPLFGQKSAAEQVGHAEESVAQAEHRLQRLVTEHMAGRQAFKLASVDEQMKHIAHRRERLLLIKEYLESRPFASPSQAVEKNLIQNRLREIEERFVQVISDREHEWQSLNVFVNLPEPILPDIKWVTNPVESNLTALQDKIDKDNPDIMKQSKIVSAAEAEIDRAGKKAYPEIKIGGGYAEENADQPQKTYFGALQFTIPILDGGAYGVQAARAKKEAESLRFEQHRREITSQFQQARTELAESRKKIALFPLSLIPTLEGQMQRAEQNWKKGLVPTPAFLELENQVHEQILKVYDSQTAYLTTVSQVYLLSGQSFPEEVR